MRSFTADLCTFLPIPPDKRRRFRTTLAGQRFYRRVKARKGVSALWPSDFGPNRFSRVLIRRVEKLLKYSPNIRLYCFHVPRTNARNPSLCRQLQRTSAEYRRASADVAGLMDRC
jgi:hypothetical protein